MTTVVPNIMPKLDKWFQTVDSHVWENPPVDLEEVSSCWGVSKVIKRPLHQSGLLHRMQDGRLIVVLNENDPLVRQRFTWAHELGHIVMAGHDSVGISCVRAGEIDRELERCCDTIAAEILMHNEQFTSYARTAGWELTAVNSLAKQFQVSLVSAAIRMNHLRDEPIVMSMWHCAKQPLVALEHRWSLPNDAARKLKPVMRLNDNTDTIGPIWEALHSSCMVTGSCRLLAKADHKSRSRTFKSVPTDALGIGQGKTRIVVAFHYLHRNH